MVVMYLSLSQKLPTVTLCFTFLGPQLILTFMLKNKKPKHVHHFNFMSRESSLSLSIEAISLKHCGSVDTV